MNTKLFFSQVNSMTPEIIKIPSLSSLSLKNDFSFVARCFYKTGNNIQVGINEQTASISKKHSSFAR